ncbi:MAG: DNA replication/repair protein RecF [Acutalibacteraceae bacterium]
MRVRSLTAVDFRNLSHTELHPCEGTNVLFGDNAHGKTNLLEAIWLFTGGKSFRGTKDADMVRFGRDGARLEMDFDAQGRTQTAVIDIVHRRRAQLNGLALPAVNRLTGHFCAVIFSPEHLSLIKDGPEARRRFLDAACCQLRPLFLPVLADYSRVLAQRNHLLKAVRNGTQPFDSVLLDAFDARLAHSGAAVRRMRREYIDRLLPHVRAIYGGLSAGREDIDLVYEAKETDGTDEVLLNAALSAARQTDLKAGFSTVGPHRDNLEVFISGVSARLFGSQGQQRSAVLSLKLAEASLLQEGYGERPVILLDDVMSELDSSRQDYILNHTQGWQVFITCCEPAALGRLADGCTFHIQNGAVCREQ